MEKLQRKNYHFLWNRDIPNIFESHHRLSINLLVCLSVGFHPQLSTSKEFAIQEKKNLQREGHLPQLLP
jgi:hypothetical protein